ASLGSESCGPESLASRTRSPSAQAETTRQSATTAERRRTYDFIECRDSEAERSCVGSVPDLPPRETHSQRQRRDAEGEQDVDDREAHGRHLHHTPTRRQAPSRTGAPRRVLGSARGAQRMNMARRDLALWLAVLAAGCGSGHEAGASLPAS